MVERHAAAGEAGAAELSRPRFWPRSFYAAPTCRLGDELALRTSAAPALPAAARRPHCPSSLTLAPSRPETKSRVGYEFPSTTTHDTAPGPPTLCARPSRGCFTCRGPASPRGCVTTS